MFVRSMFAKALKKEVGYARSRGIPVMVIRPWLTDLKQHGMNSMRHFDRASLVDSTREGTLRFLEGSREDPALVAFMKSKTSSEEERAAR